MKVPWRLSYRQTLMILEVVLQVEAYFVIGRTR